MFPNLREITDQKNVKNTLMSCAQEKTPFFIWIKEDDDRIKSEAVLSEISFEDKIIGSFKDTSLNADKVNIDVFLYHEDKKILFKGKITGASDGNLTIEIDPKIFLQEKRKRGRFYFKKIDVVVKLQVQGINDGKSFFTNLSDISEEGMCFEVLQSKGYEFDIKSQVKLINIEGIKFPEKILGKIVHLTQFKDPAGEKLQKVGVAFDESNPIIGEVMLVMGNSKKS